MGRLPETNRLKLAIALPLRNTNEMANLLKDLYANPANPRYRHFLTPREFTDRFGPTERDYGAVIAFVQSNGFAVSATYSNRMLFDVEAAVSDIERTFHLTLRTYPHPTEGRDFYAPDVEPALKLATPVLHISGLDDFTLPRPQSHIGHLNAGQGNAQGGSGPGGTFVAQDFRNAYAPGVTLDGSGQSVAIFQLAGYYPSDIRAYEQSFGLSTNIPVVYELLDGITNITTEAGVGEAALDIEMVISMATNLTSVITYFGNSTDDILNQIANDDLAAQISASWTYAIDNTSLQIFQQFAAQGQSFFNASGDADAYTGSPASPTDAPYLTSVGGTILTTVSDGSWSSEVVWNMGGGVGSSGGISTTYLLPRWQQGIDMTDNQGSTTMRNIPDVAMVAENVLVIYDNGNAAPYYGTSCATPLWAGFMALVNQQAATNGYPPVGFLNPALYALAEGPNYADMFHDITNGNNYSSTSPNEFFACPGYDLCTGWGTPQGSNLINALAIPDPLGVVPPPMPTITGPVGGPFSQTNLNFTLTNMGTAALNWSLASTSAWLNASAESGILGTGTVFTVTATVNAAAAGLAAGIYPATIIVSNATTGVFQAFDFNLIAGVGLVWNSTAGTGAPQDGSGVWANQYPAGTNWWNGSGNVQWNNGGPDVATFGVGSGSAGTVTLSGAITSAGINFTPAGSGNYKISGTNLLTLDGNINAAVSGTINAPVMLGFPASFTVASSQTLTVNGLLAGGNADDLTIVGPGTVSLTTLNTNAAPLGMAGNVYVNSGTLSVNSSNSAYGVLGNVAGIYVGGGAVLSLQSSNALSGFEGLARNVTLNNGALTVSNGNHQVDLLTLNGGTVSGNGSSTVGSLNLQNSCYVTADSTINAQHVTLLAPYRTFCVSTNVTLTFSGSIINGRNNVSSLALDGGGVLVLTAANSFTGFVTINSGTLQLNPGGDGANSTVGLLGSVSNITINAAGVLETLGTNAVSGSGGSARNLVLNGGNLIDGSGNHAISNLTLNGGTVSGLGNPTFGSYNLKGNCTVTANSTISAQNFTTATGSVFNVSGGVTLAIPGSIIGNGGCRIVGAGTIVISGTNTYTGNTTVTNGTLEINGALGNTTVLIQGGTLTGTGQIAGPVLVTTNSSFVPGANNSLGTMAVNNQLSLAGTTFMFLNRTNLQNCSSVTGITTLTNGGALIVSNLGPPPQAGDSFQLFFASAYSGNFSAVSLPVLEPGLGWDLSRLASGGILSVDNLLSITGAITPGGEFQITFGGPPGETYRVLAATNLLLPSTNWAAIAAGTFSAGPTNFTDPDSTNSPLQFYRLVSP